ncbi:MAG: 8-amino-7-oxononanoate synthase [Candidatus Omnitrophota bacterium]
MAELENFLKSREEAGLLRCLKPISRRHNGRVYFKTKEFIDFSSNDYLGLANHPKLLASAKEALDRFGTSASASRLLSGDLEIHHRLEEEVARFKNKESALVFNSGYQANVGILSALYSKGDAIFSDRLNHASIIDGILLSGARLFRFKHNDPNHLEEILKKERGKFKKALIVTETIFSMDGDRPFLKDLVVLKDKYGCRIMVDEAHATGIFGKNGSGVVEEEELTDRIDLIMGTFSKALGSFGAYLAASRKVSEYLINTCRSFIYSTALPPAVAACNLTSISLLREEPYRRKELLSRAGYFRETLRKKGFMVKGESQIVPLIIGKNPETVRAAGTLQKRGYWVLPIRPPTVPRGQARLRFSLTFFHNQEILDGLMDEIPRD